ncbi:MAG TPA: type I glutamate--ammonia ligase [Dehalococcoidia bacterium]|nr:type I glutamate--ammonia ligase [Dehalococcoidia bacterium]
MTAARKLDPAATPAQIIEFCREQGIQIVDLRFIDMPGIWQHLSIPLYELDFEKGTGFDGSSIRGFQPINESDMLLVPDPASAFVDPAYQVPTLVLICNIRDPLTRGSYSRDPRYIAQKAERYLRDTGIATTSYWGPEIEFFLFNSLSFDQDSHSGYYFIDSEAGIWNSGRNGSPNLAYRPRYKEGYFPVPPTDKFQDVRSEMVIALGELGIATEAHHHEVATAGQAEIDMRFTTLTKMADQVMMYKYVIRNIAYQKGLVANFMPKPLFGDNGSGMHTHQSLWNGDTPLFYNPEGYALISDMCRWYIGGILTHAPSILAFAAPTTNSYRRLVPGYEAPINLIYSLRNRSAAVRIPSYFDTPRARRIEVRFPDPSCNPYLSFSAMLMAGLDGVQNRIEPPAPIDKDLYELEPEERVHVTSTPGSLGEVLAALERDHDYLLKGDVFTRDLLEMYIDFKRKRELEPVALRPHPYEFFLYSDI